jgi:hypothetical protein
VPWGEADIFFPTDFDLLAQLYRRAAGSAIAQREQQQQEQRVRQQEDAGGGAAGGGAQHTQQGPGQQQAAISATHAPQPQFMDQLADKDATRTISGWDPLRKDFHNTRVFTGSCRQQGD